MNNFSLTLPIKTVSEANSHAHWRGRARRAKLQRFHVWSAVSAYLGRWPKGKLTIRLTRIAPRKLDSDNAVGALKHVRDGVADAIGRNDGDETLTWVYAQERGEPQEYAVRIEIL